MPKLPKESGSGAMKLELARRHCVNIVQGRVTGGIGTLLASSILLVVEYLLERDMEDGSSQATIRPPEHTRT